MASVTAFTTGTMLMFVHEFSEAWMLYGFLVILAINYTSIRMSISVGNIIIAIHIKAEIRLLFTCLEFLTSCYVTLFFGTG